MVTPGPVAGSSPAYSRTRRRSARISSTETSPRAVFWSSVASSRSRVATSRAELVVAGVEVGDEDRQVLRRQLGEGRAARLGPQLDDDEQAEDEGDGRDGELVAARCIVSRPDDVGEPATARAASSAGSPSRRRPACRPISGSANETRMP